MSKLNEFLHQKEILKQLRRTCASGDTSLVIDFDKFLEFDLELAKNLMYNPAELLAQANGILEEITKIPGMCLRVRGLDKTFETKDIRASHVGKFVQVSGAITWVSKPKLVKINEEPEEFEDYQEIQLDDFLSVVLRRDLVGKVGPEDQITLTGTLGAVKGKEFYDFILEANHLEVCNGHAPSQAGPAAGELAEAWGDGGADRKKAEVNK